MRRGKRRGKRAKVKVPREVRKWIEDSSLYVPRERRADGSDGIRRGRRGTDLG